MRRIYLTPALVLICLSVCGHRKSAFDCMCPSVVTIRASAASGQEDGQTANPLEANIESEDNPSSGNELQVTDSDIDATPAEEDVFEVDLIPLTGSQDSSAQPSDDSSAREINLSIDNKFTPDLKTMMEPVLSPVRKMNGQKALPVHPLSVSQKQVLSTNSSIITIGNKKYRRTRRLYRLPLGHKMPTGEEVRWTPDGRLIRISRRPYFLATAKPASLPKGVH